MPLRSLREAAIGIERGGAHGAITIERHDSRFDALIGPEARLEVLASGEGLAWVEGPVWVPSGGYLLFSDIPNNRVMQWSRGGGLRVFLERSGYTGAAPFPGKEPGSNGLTLDRQGRLVLAEHGDRRISRLEPDGSKTTLVDRYQGRRLNSPNDLVYMSSGDLYFTDPPFGLPETFRDPAKELDFQGVFRLSASGTTTLLTRELHAPNGIAFSPDERTLYVSNSRPSAWWAFPVNADGTLGSGRLFYDGAPLAARWPGSADGLKVDRKGNIFAAGPGGVHVFSPAGELLGSIVTGQRTANVAWGEDGSTLFITGSQTLYCVRAEKPGR